MSNYRLCWQHLADEYRTIGKVAEANRAAAPVRSLSSAAPKQAGIRSSKAQSALLIVE
jgi:predicted Zn-dependent protease